MQSTLGNKPKTHQRVLPQPSALRVSGDGQGKVKPGQSETCSHVEQAVSGHDRGERPAVSAGPSPEPGRKAQSEQSGVTRVFVLSKDGRPLMPCHAARARELLSKGKVVVVRRYPFVIRLKHNPVEAKTQSVGIKIDPGAKTSGLGIVRITPETAHHVLHLAEVTHRGEIIKAKMKLRKGYRGNRRSRKTRYRQCRFKNRKRSEGWLPPSLQSRVDNVIAWVERYRRWAPITHIVVERVRFDTQRLVNPEIEGTEYQQGTLHGYEMREYLLEKWGRACVYCDTANVPLEIDHIKPKGGKGSGWDRVSNLTLACHPCNQKKGAQALESFLEGNPQRLERILQQCQTPLAAAAAVNATRQKLFQELFKSKLPVKASTGGETKFNRTRLGIPKSHALDAVCTGETPAVRCWQIGVLSDQSLWQRRLSANPGQ